VTRSFPELMMPEKAKINIHQKEGKVWRTLNNSFFVALSSRIFAKKMLQFADVSWASTVSLFTAVIHEAIRY
jgi:hypothetical protein